MLGDGHDADLLQESRKQNYLTHQAASYQVELQHPIIRMYQIHASLSLQNLRTRMS